jgi:hypothetical protein
MAPAVGPTNLNRSRAAFRFISSIFIHFGPSYRDVNVEIFGLDLYRLGLCVVVRRPVGALGAPPGVPRAGKISKKPFWAVFFLLFRGHPMGI